MSQIQVNKEQLDMFKGLQQNNDRSGLCFEGKIIVTVVWKEAKLERKIS